MNEKFKEVIRIIHQRLDGIKWALVGSTNMQLQGIPIQPRDLDICVRRIDLEELKELFSDYPISNINELKPFNTEQSWEVKIIISHVEVQFFGQNDTGEYVSKLLADRIIQIKLDDIMIPCFTLDAEEQTYAETHREQKAHLIREFLSTRRGN